MKKAECVLSSGDSPDSVLEGGEKCLQLVRVVSVSDACGIDI